MKRKKFLSLMLTGAISASVFAAPAYAMKGDGGSRDDGNGGNNGGQGQIEYSSTAVTVPPELADGTYQGDVTVEPDDTDGFNHYPITVAVKVSGGSIESFLVSGASGSDTQYSKRAEEGINSQLAGKTAGTYEVDAVTMATCSSSAIVQGINKALQSQPTNTSLSLSTAVYNKAGSEFYVIVTDPTEGKDYSNIIVSYARGKFANELTAGTEYTVQEVTPDSASQKKYKITILATGKYTIDDDGLTHDGYYNSLGLNLDVKVDGSSAGRVVLNSGASVQLKNNKLSLTGGNGETLADYIGGIDSVEVSYADANGETVTNKYTTQWQHDVDPEYNPNDFFNEDGSINFNIAPFANGESGKYTITVTSSGFESLTANVGAKDIPEKGTELTDEATQSVYKVTKSGETGGTVEFVKTQAEQAKSVSIPATVELDGISYKVTSVSASALRNNKTVTKLTIGKNVSKIGKNAFRGCSKLKSITIKTTKLTSKSVGAKAFSGVSSKAAVKVPKSKLTAYKTLLKSKGLNGKNQTVKK